MADCKKKDRQRKSKQNERYKLFDRARENRARRMLLNLRRHPNDLQCAHTLQDFLKAGGVPASMMNKVKSQLNSFFLSKMEVES